MRAINSVAARAARPWRLLLVAAACGAAACTTSGTHHPRPIETRGEGTFTITEPVHVSANVLADFEEALRLLDQKQYDRGIPLLVTVTQAAPEVTTAYIDLGIAYGQQGDLENAKASLEKALELDPRHPVALNELGMVYRKMGRFQQARRSYEAALAAYPDFHFARRNLAILCDVYLNDLKCALANYELYVQAVPDDDAAAIWVADLRKRAGE